MATATDETVKFMDQDVLAYPMVGQNMGNQNIVFKKPRSRNKEDVPLYVEVTLRVPMEFLKGKCLMEGFKGMFWYIDPIEPKTKKKEGK